MLTQYQVSMLNGPRGGIVDPGSLSPIVDLLPGTGTDPVGTGYYQSIPNAGSLGGTAVPPALDTNNMPQSDPGPTPFTANCPYFSRTGGATGQSLYMSVANAFDILRYSPGATLFQRMYMASVLNPGGYGMFFGDMPGAGGNVGIHVKYYLPSNGNNTLLLDAGNGTSIFSDVSADNAILPSTYYTLATRCVSGPTMGKVCVQVWLDGVLTLETPEFTPNTGGSTSQERICNFAAGPAAAAEGTMQRLTLVPSASDNDIRGVHAYFLANP